MRHTKIIATIGPASASDEVIEQMIDAGVDICRLNFSHGSHETHQATFLKIRGAAERAKKVVSVLQDLSGPKIRTGRLQGGTPELDARVQAIAWGKLRQFLVEHLAPTP